MAHQYRVSFNVIENWSLFFDANSEEEAKELLQKVIDDEMSMTELPGFHEKNHSIETEIEDTLAEWYHDKALDKAEALGLGKDLTTEE